MSEDLRARIRNVFPGSLVRSIDEREFTNEWMPFEIATSPRPLKVIDEQNAVVYKEDRGASKKGRAAATRARNKPIRMAGHKPDNVWWLLRRWPDRTVEEIEKALEEGRELEPKQFKEWVKETLEKEQS